MAFLKNNVDMQVFKTGNEVCEKLRELIENCASISIKERDCFSIGLSGGSLIKLLKIVLPQVKTIWNKWKLFFCDERLVSIDSPDSTFGLYQKELLELVPLELSQFVTVDTSLSVEAAAKDYQKKIYSHFPNVDFPKFDVLLLGMGPDGHTASLFPDHKLLNEKELWIAPIDDSPKPPPCRVTMTLPVLNNARNCIFAITGTGKAEVIKRILVDHDSSLPVGLITPTAGRIVWLLDQDSGAEIPTC